MRIDDYEHPSCAGEDHSLLIDDFGHAHMPSSAFADFARLHPQRPAQRHRPEVVNLHLRSGGDNIPQLAQLTHGFIENGRDDSTMAMPRWAGVAPRKTKITNRPPPFLIERKIQVHTVQVGLPASEAEVHLLSIDFAAVPSARVLFRHRARIVPER